MKAYWLKIRVCDSEKTGSDSQFWDTLAPSDTPARYFSNCIVPGPGYLAEIILSALTKPLSVIPWP